LPQPSQEQQPEPSARPQVIDFGTLLEQLGLLNPAGVSQLALKKEEKPSVQSPDASSVPAAGQVAGNFKKEQEELRVRS
jgi:hypothetical protein